MNNTSIKRRFSSASEKENESKWLNNICLKRVKVEPSDQPKLSSFLIESNVALIEDEEEM